MSAKLTPEACRAARALLGYSTQEFAELVRTSPTTINGLEAGKAIRASTEARIVDYLGALGVEITNGDGTGARIRSDPLLKAARQVIRDSFDLGLPETWPLGVADMEHPAPTLEEAQRVWDSLRGRWARDRDRGGM